MEWQLILAVVGVVSLLTTLSLRWEQFIDSSWEDVGVFLLGIVGLAVGVLLIVRYFSEYGETAAIWSALTLVGGLLLAFLGVELMIISGSWDRFR